MKSVATDQEIPLVDPHISRVFTLRSGTWPNRLTSASAANRFGSMQTGRSILGAHATVTKPAGSLNPLAKVDRLAAGREFVDVSRKPRSASKRSPLLLNARPTGPFNPPANVDRIPPGVNCRCFPRNNCRREEIAATVECQLPAAPRHSRKWIGSRRA